MKYQFLIIYFLFFLAQLIKLKYQKSKFLKGKIQQKNKHKKILKKCKGKNCPEEGGKIIADSIDVNDHTFKKEAEQKGKLGCGAYSEEEIKHLKMKYPKLVDSLTYYDLDRNEYESEGDSQTGETYYDPSQEIFGDYLICNKIKDGNDCVCQEICGWCGSDQKCILGTIQSGKQECTDPLTYSYSAFPGWNPKNTLPPKNTTITDQCDKNDKVNTNLSENNLDSNNQHNIFDNIKINNFRF